MIPSNSTPRLRRARGFALVLMVRVVAAVPMVLKPMMVVLVMAVAVLARAPRLLVTVGALPVARRREIGTRREDDTGQT